MKELEEVFGECETGAIETKTAKKTFKAFSSNSIKNLCNMNIIKAIEPNLGVNILEEDSEVENQEEQSSGSEEQAHDQRRRQARSGVRRQEASVDVRHDEAGRQAPQVSSPTTISNKSGVHSAAGY